MESTEIAKYDQQEIYCRKLGHHLPFRYCRQELQSLPCSGIKRCWYSRVPVDKFLIESFSLEEIMHLDEPNISKVHTILNIMENLQSKKT